MSTLIEQLEDFDFDAWDDFVFGHPDGTFCHLSGWKTVIEKGAGQKCPYLVAKKGSAITGVLPLTVKRHPIFGKALISNMFCVYGGVLASNRETADQLIAEAWELAGQLNLPVLELRGMQPMRSGQENWVEMAGSATFIRDLASTDEEQLLAIPRKQRAVVRKSLKNELVTEWVSETDVFYDLYARSVWSLGTPVFPKKLFSGLKDVFKDKVAIQITKNKEGAALASLMSFYFKETVMPYYAGGGELVRKYAAHDFMYYQLMLEARARGCSQFDFGRSKVDSGPYKFKKNWGFDPQPLGYEMRLAEGVVPPNLSQQSGPFATLSNIWKKLPFAVTKAIGPHLARHLG